MTKNSNSRASWVTGVNQTIQQNKTFHRAVMNNPNVQNNVANFLYLLQKQIDHGELSQQQALNIFKTTVKQLSNDIQKQINQLQKPLQPRHDDLSNTMNMTMALQTAGSLASMQMVDAACAIEQAVNDTMASTEQASIEEATNEIEAENNLIANAQSTPEITASKSALTEGVELAAACDLAKKAIEDVFGKGIDEAEKLLTDAFKDIGEKMGFKTDEIKDLEKDFSEEFSNPFKMDLKPPKPEEK